MALPRTSGTASTRQAAPRKRRAQSAPAGDAAAALLAAFDDLAAVLPADAAAPLVWCSPALVALLGLAEGEAPTLQALCARLAGLAEGVAALGASGAPAGADWDGEVQLDADRDGSATAHLHAALRRLSADGAWQAGAALGAAAESTGGGALALRLRLLDSGGPPALERATRRHLEDRERLLFTSRSVAVGEMATTLAHELNQPLGAVTNVLRGLKTRIATAAAQPLANALPMLEQGVQLALDQVQYAARIIGRIRDYTQSRQPRRERVDLNALLHNSLTMLDWDLGRHGVQLSMALAPEAQDGATAVAGDGVMLQQVLVNLLRNAIDAMGDTPAGQRRLDIVSRIDAAGTQIEIAIADTGSGIDDEGAAQLFMPFYSTKPTGMGIGLNICRSLIELHQGRLWFTPNPGLRGCTFHVALPLVQGDEALQLPRFMDSEAVVS